MKFDKPLTSFFWKIYITSLILVGIAVIFTAIVYRNVQKKTYLDQLEREFKTEAFLLSQIFSSSQKPYIIEEWRLGGKPRITVINENGEVLLETQYNPFKMENQLERPEIRNAIQNGWGKSIRWSQSIGVKMYFVAVYYHYNNRPDMIIRLSVPMYEIKKKLNSTTSKVVLGGIFIFFITSLFGLIMAKEVANPIIIIASHVKEFFNGKSNIRIPCFRSNDMNLLSSELNRMFVTITRDKGELSVVKDQTGKILLSMHDGIILVDNNGIIRQANNSARKIFGYNVEELIDKNVYSLFQSEDISGGVGKIIQGEEFAGGKISVFSPDERIIEFSCTPFGDRSGVVIVLHDITKINILEKTRKEFVAGVSHELKTPITSMKGFVETLLEMDPLDEVVLKKFLNIINKNIIRMENIIHDLLMLSKMESGSNVLPDDIININDCIKNSYKIIKSRYPERKINIIGDEFAFFIKGDGNLIEIALLNLFDNAIKYSSKDVNVILDANYRKVFISIEDKGFGIPEKDIDKIFESFYRVDKTRSRELGGTGLGLTIVKHIIGAHKGRVKVKNSLGMGTTFIVELPRYMDY